MEKPDESGNGKRRGRRKWPAVIAALVPVLATLLIVGRLADVTDLKTAKEKAETWAAGAKGWAITALGGSTTPGPESCPPSTSGGLPPEEAARQMDNAYAELVKALAPQVQAEQIRIQQSPEKLEIRFLEQVLFNTGSAKITQQGQDILDKTGQALAKIQEKYFTILGHTDNVPIKNDFYPSNWELSTARASSVVRFLSEKEGIAPTRFYAVGRADCDPVADNDSDAGRSKNRRVEILVTNLECLRLISKEARQE